MSPKQRPDKHENLIELVRRHALEGAYVLLRHARERQAQRRITELEFLHVLEHGWHERRKDVFDEAYAAWSYSIRGKTIDERELRVVVSFDEEEPDMLIITLIDLSG